VFRDSEGNIGFLNEHCCHRGASLLLGRVENCGIRCIYHGWKFGVDGTVQETPNVADPKFKERIKTKAYPVREAAGLLWVYLGTEETPPLFPEQPWFGLPDSHRINACPVFNCNYIQVMEGLLDSSHLNILHTMGMNQTYETELNFANFVKSMASDPTPEIDVEETEFGLHYVALRDIPDKEGVQARITAFISPCFIKLPNGDVMLLVVPVNDHRTNFYHIWWDAERKIGEEPLRSRQLEFVGLDEKTLKEYGLTKETCDDRGPNRSNRFFQNRGVLNKHFSGLYSIIQEDAAAATSAGGIRDRSVEKLCPADAAITRLYYVLLKCTRKVEAGQPPIGLDRVLDYANIIGANGTVPDRRAWRTLVPGHKTVVDN
jgi:nitrite reductase/ring-hydroxylating ferredoxin subunit